MPRELITIQVGQCGMQLGTKFWELALMEHAKNANKPYYDDAMSSFFRNVDTRYKGGKEIPVGDGKGEIRSLKARTVLVDMEEGVINEVMNGPMRDLFDTTQIIHDVSGSGNNWAHGHCEYGPKYREQIIETIRRTVEPCDSLQSFFLMHSLGGGTGSGLGTYILSILEDEYPDVYRFTTAIFPSENDDVITSPYNSILSLGKLIEHADCVLPIDNQSLLDICNRIKKKQETNKSINSSSSSRMNNKHNNKHDSMLSNDIKLSSSSSSSSRKKKKNEAFNDMNRIAAHLLTNLTCSMRFEGALNVDLNEITMNLVPYPKLKFLMSSMSPLSLEHGITNQVRGIDHMFTDVLHRDNQLLRADPKNDMFLACGLMVRGPIQMSDVTRNITKMKLNVDMIHWNSDGFKVGLCSTPPVGQPYSLLCLSNNCAIKTTLFDIRRRFNLLYRVKAHTHHYTDYMEMSQFQESLEQVTSVISEYSGLKQSMPEKMPLRFQPLL